MSNLTEQVITPYNRLSNTEQKFIEYQKLFDNFGSSFNINSILNKLESIIERIPFDKNNYSNLKKDFCRKNNCKNPNCNFVHNKQDEQFILIVRKKIVEIYRILNFFRIISEQLETNEAFDIKDDVKKLFCEYDVIYRLCKDNIEKTKIEQDELTEKLNLIKFQLEDIDDKKKEYDELVTKINLTNDITVLDKCKNDLELKLKDKFEELHNLQYELNENKILVDIIKKNKELSEDYQFRLETRQIDNYLIELQQKYLDLDYLNEEIRKKNEELAKVTSELTNQQFKLEIRKDELKESIIKNYRESYKDDIYKELDGGDKIIKLMNQFLSEVNNTLGKFGIKEINEKFVDNQLCPICLQNNFNIITECGHSFCEECFTKWMEENETCPTCRQKVTNYIKKY